MRSYALGGRRDEDDQIVEAQWGWVGEGRVLVAPRFERVGEFSEGLMAVQEAGRWGFCDKYGQPRIAAAFDEVGGFADGLAAAAHGGRWGFIGTDGRWRIAPQWEAAGGACGGRVRVRVAGRWHFADLSGRLVSEGYDDCLPYIEGMAHVERDDDHWRCRRRTAARSSPGHSRNVGPYAAVPAEGLTHPGFAHADETDELRITVCPRRTPDLEGSLAMQQIVRNWLDLLEADAQRGVLVGDRPWIADYAVSLRIKNVEQPVRAADVLVRELAAANLPIQEVDFARFREDPQADFRVVGLWSVVPAVPHPDDPRGSDFFGTFDEYIEAAFDGEQTPPASESAQHLLAGRWDGRAECLRFAERTFTLHAPDIRICYGMCQEGFGPPDARTASVHRALVEAFAARFDPRTIWVFPGAREVRVPQPLVRDGSPGVERIEAYGRVGYCFGVEAFDLLQDIGPDAFRYRENELMEAVCAVVRRLELAPVVTWQRFGDPLPVPSAPGMAHPMQPTMYALNLWER